MKPVSSGKSPFPGAVYELALALQWIGLCISPATWTMTQDEHGVAVYFQWQHKSSRGSSAQDGQPGQMAATHQPRPAKKQKPPSRQKRDKERWLRHQAQRKQASRQQKPQSKGESSREPPIAEVPVVQVASLEPQAAYSQPLRLNADAPEFKPNTVVKTTSHPFIGNNDHLNNVKISPSQITTSLDNSVDTMSNSVKSDSDNVNSDNDSDLPFSGINEMNTSEILDPSAIIKEDLIHTKSKLQRTSNKLQRTIKELKQISDMKDSTMRRYNQLLKDHELLQFNHGNAKSYNQVMLDKWNQQCEWNYSSLQRSRDLQDKLTQLKKQHDKATLDQKNQEATINSLQAELKKKDNTIEQHKANALKAKQHTQTLQHENRQLCSKLHRSTGQHPQTMSKKTFNRR